MGEMGPSDRAEREPRGSARSDAEAELICWTFVGIDVGARLEGSDVGPPASANVLARGEDCMLAGDIDRDSEGLR